MKTVSKIRLGLVYPESTREEEMNYSPSLFWIKWIALIDFPVPVSPGVIIWHIFSTNIYVKNIIL